MVPSSYDSSTCMGDLSVITCNPRNLLVSAVLCLTALSLVSCGDDDDSSGVFVPSGPRVNTFSTTSAAAAGNFTSVTQSVSVPGGIPFTDDAFSLIYTPQTGGGGQIETVFSADQVNCVPGATSCSSSFQPRVPFDLPVLPADYLVTFTVIDQAGRVASDSQTVFITIAVP